MFLRELEIKNFRSLEAVELKSIGKLNVLIGKNNSGKSAVFGALQTLNHAIRGASIDWPSIVTAKDPRRSLELRLRFELSHADREDFIAAAYAAGIPDARRETVLNSPLARQVEYEFKSAAGAPQLLHIRATRLIAENNEWATVQRFGPEDDRGGNPLSRVTMISNEAARSPAEPLHRQRLECDQSGNAADVRISCNLAGQMDFAPDRAARWPLSRLEEYLRRAFFFNPFRHSTARLPVRQTDQLAQDGANLAQVLHTINSNDRELFNEIEAVIQAALPDVGRLQTPLAGTDTELHFRSPEGYLVRLADMGGGVEQLLMVATVLLTTSDEHALFLEEPESHLHAGAQRFLMERLSQGSRQGFVTTHSATLVNSPKPTRIYQVSYAKNRTTIELIGDTVVLSSVLADIGSRNSDVLLSDAVLFVEGTGDRGALLVLSELIGKRLEDHNVTVLTMGGGERAGREVPIRVETLVGISRRAPVPHMFVIDRDERRADEIERLERELAGVVHVLEARELENYLLVPRALREALRDKYASAREIAAKLSGSSDDEIRQVIEEAVDSLFGLVLLKRIRVQLGGLVGGLVPRELAVALAGEAANPKLGEVLLKGISSRFQKEVETRQVERIVEEQREVLTRAWGDKMARSKLAPGEEVIGAVFSRYGGEYRKPDDAIRIAQKMQAEEVSPEIRNIVDRAVRLTRAE